MVRFITAVVSCLFVGLGASVCLAGGLEYTENSATILGRDGAFTARADHPMAIHYNPAGLMVVEGHRIYVGANVTQLQLRFTRGGIDDAVDQGQYETATIENEAPPYIAPSAAYVWSNERWGWGLGVYGPAGYGKRTYPREGAQRAMLTNADLLLGYVTGTAAYRIDSRVSLGLSLQWVVSPSARFGLTVDGGPDASAFVPAEADSAGYTALAQADLEVKDMVGFAAVLGLHMRPADFYEMGLAIRPLPTEMDATGDLSLTFPDESLGNLHENGLLKLVNDNGDDEYGIHFRYTLPPWVRFGQRFIKRDAEGREVADLELDVTYEFWHVLDGYHVTFDGRLYFLGNTPALEEMTLEKDWRDTLAVRLGGTWSVLPDRLRLSAGVHYETAAMPDHLTNIDFVGYNRVGAAMGVGLTLGAFQLNLAYQYVLQPTRVITNSRVSIQRPLDPADEPLHVGDGTFESSFQTLALGLGAQF